MRKSYKTGILIRTGWLHLDCKFSRVQFLILHLVYPAHTAARSSLFGLFSAGMAGSTTQLIYRNLSTVDALSHTLKVYQLAIYDPAPPQQPQQGQRQIYSPLVQRVWLPTSPMQEQQQRCFAIVKTQPGENPWRLGETMDNFKEVLGYSIWDWWLPLKGSPLVNRNNAEGFYRWNDELLKRLRREAGIETGTAPPSG